MYVYIYNNNEIKEAIDLMLSGHGGVEVGDMWGARGGKEKWEGDIIVF